MGVGVGGGAARRKQDVSVEGCVAGERCARSLISLP